MRMFPHGCIGSNCAALFSGEGSKVLTQCHDSMPQVLCLLQMFPHCVAATEYAIDIFSCFARLHFGYCAFLRFPESCREQLARVMALQDHTAALGHEQCDCAGHCSLHICQQCHAERMAAEASQEYSGKHPLARDADWQQVHDLAAEQGELRARVPLDCAGAGVHLVPVRIREHALQAEVDKMVI